MKDTSRFERARGMVIDLLDSTYDIDCAYLAVVPEFYAEGDVFIELLGEITLTGLKSLLLRNSEIDDETEGMAERLRKRLKSRDMEVLNLLSSFVDDPDIDVRFNIVELGGTPDGTIGTKIAADVERIKQEVINLLRFEDDPLGKAGYDINIAAMAMCRICDYATPALHDLQYTISDLVTQGLSNKAQAA
ncbi:hypothetical protein [Halomonas sp. KO116]|uniref:hypothetical protein n=1 Tax=Halomonas sp. KO116 TaxID=1504981 RepID=UPI0004E2DC21|nr:hypothetical protein [Halomonas sp. KO116]AJY53201.1 hypothetical protein KO116_P200094 [Halomonas sp. KO116]